MEIVIAIGSQPLNMMVDGIRLMFVVDDYKVYENYLHSSELPRNHSLWLRMVTHIYKVMADISIVHDCWFGNLIKYFDISIRNPTATDR